MDIIGLTPHLNPLTSTRRGEDIRDGYAVKFERWRIDPFCRSALVVSRVLPATLDHYTAPPRS